MSSDSGSTTGSAREAQEARPEMSVPTSPTDTRQHPLATVESISQKDDGLSESFQSTDTVRRRPETTSYGTIQPQPGSQNQPEHKPSESSQGSHSQSLESSRSTLQPMPSPMLGPERGRGGQKPKKPGMARRASSNVQGPHRGQEFSVDDDVAEMEGALARQSATSGFGSVKNQPSTLRRRPKPEQPALSRVDSSPEEEASSEAQPEMAGVVADEQDTPEVTEEVQDVEDETPDEDDDGLSDAESFTLKDRQEAINETHPFGIRIWKPALYKKDRSVQKTAEGDIHSSPGGRVHNWLLFFNIVWTICFGWWLGLVALAGAVVCFIFGAAPSAVEYGQVLWGLAGYLFYPFGKFVRLEQDEAYAHEDEGEGRTITEYEQWQSGDIEDGRLFFGPHGNRSIVGRSRRSIDSFASETDSLLGRTMRGAQRESSERPLKRRLFGRGQWNTGRVIFFLFFYGLITPLLFVVSGICWFLVFWIPMGKVTMLLFHHLRRHPLALSFESDTGYSRGANIPNSSILLCTYRAVGLKYWKYTIDGTNIFLINLMAVVLFVILDYWVLVEALDMDLAITHPAFLFIMALFSIIPLAYFIGQAVASISAQSSMGLGAAINAFFSTLVEVFLYCVALNQGKGQLVEGSIIGSIFAGILFLPGLSMCFGAIKRKTQRFNVKSAGVTSTMLLFAVIAAFGPTLFYQIYGTHELNCLNCVDTHEADSSRDCARCYFSQVPALNDRFYLEAVRPYCWFAAVLLFFSYVIGLWFTLRTHAAVIWNNEVDEKRHQDAHNQAASQQPLSGPPHGRLQRNASTLQNTNEAARGAEIRESQLYKRILGQSLKQVGLSPTEDASKDNTTDSQGPNGSSQTPHIPPPKTSSASARSVQIPGLSEAENTSLIREVAEMAATAATIAARDATRGTRKSSVATHKPPRASVMQELDELIVAETHGAAGGGHDAPNWSRMKSSIVLCGATLLYAMIAEILVNTVDVVLKNVAIDEKFLGITLFALVPNTTEFLNAISFAMNGNIALSMEIGSAYALQVCLLQIPALVLFSAITGQWLEGPDVADRTFSLIFPQWDMVTVILCVFLLSYMYGEGKSNYFKGSILLLTYSVVIVGFYLSGMTDLESMGMSRFDIMEAGGSSYKTIGRKRSGIAFHQ
ncbi:Low affinity vacuolar monovalent cation/H(+) antiporter [Lachnellula occidentalis]|uniref:Low affinity vacuolar monovalent cation/H(+) antiporter n=1 Tax=Lachnellula occidentalis TaxID=215460 RepID=A0A8H8S670_9HELO|nr:Low affinity vacuolar monovalent cation/H(+) antiporter [Lachnellula occidentalis]